MQWLVRTIALILAQAELRQIFRTVTKKIEKCGICKNSLVSLEILTSALQNEKQMDNHGAVIFEILLYLPLFKKEKNFVRYWFGRY